MADGAQFTDGDPELGLGPPQPPLQAWRDDGHGRRTAPDEVWAAVRDDYLAGLSAAEACRRHGVRLTAMRARAAREGWRRADQPWAPSNRLDPEDEGVELEARVGGDLDKVEMHELSWVADRRMARAVLRGDALGALRWRRVRDAMDAESAEMERLNEQHEAIWKSRRDHIESFGDPAADEPEDDEVDSSDSSDSVFHADD